VGIGRRWLYAWPIDPHPLAAAPGTCQQGTSPWCTLPQHKVTLGLRALEAQI
jgi:hypothetical protein